MIRDELDRSAGHDATPDLGDGLAARVVHARHATRGAAGNWLSCFSSCCRPSRHDNATVAGSPSMASQTKHDNEHTKELPFNRADISQKLKTLIEGLDSICPAVSELIKTYPTSVPAPMKRPATSSVITQKKLNGRDAIFHQTIDEMLKCGTHHDHTENMSVLPIVGPGDIGKTTFTQHLYNDNRAKQHFTAFGWVCVSTNFDVTELSRKILKSLDANGSEGSIRDYDKCELDQLHKFIQEKLKSKKFLIVFDDIWEHDSSKPTSTKSFSKGEWEKLLAPLGMGETSGNMVLVTTRFPKVANAVTKGTNQVDLHGLEPDEFWEFFRQCAFSGTEDDNDMEILTDIAKQIAKKLKCSPLAAKTVGPLLHKNPTRKHWRQILEKEEWLKQKDGDDSIIPALKISYDYLPFHLKKCFSYCALFPEDYKFDMLEISCFWDSIGIIDSNGKNDKTEDIGSRYLSELYDNGFMMKGDDNHYVMHDLLHELSQIVSSAECAYINYSSFRADDIQPSIRHLSITIKDKYIESFKGEMEKLKDRVDIRNLRSVMIFGGYRSIRTANVLKDTLNQILALRVLFIFINSPDSLPHNFSKLVHLRYLKIETLWRCEVCIPSTVSKLYHLKFLDLKSWGGNDYNLPKDFSRLINLHHFLADEEFHSNVSEVGKMKCLLELKEFHVKKGTLGFELAQLGQLQELGGELCICGLENVNKEEAVEAKLKDKSNLSKLRLVCGTEHGDDILDSLEPHSNLTELSIVNVGGGLAPSWLGKNMHITNLDTLHLDGLDSLECIDCPNLNELPLSSCSGSSAEETNTMWFPNLCRLEIRGCPQLSLALVPHTSTLTYIHLNDTILTLDNDVCFQGYNGALAFQNLGYFEGIYSTAYIRHMSLIDFQPLHSLQKLLINLEDCECEDTFFRGLDEDVNVVVFNSIKDLGLYHFSLTRKVLSNLFKCFPALHGLSITSKESNEEVTLQIPSSCSLRYINLWDCKNLMLPVNDGVGLGNLTSLESLTIGDCGNIFSQWYSHMGKATQTTSNPFPSSLSKLYIYKESSIYSMALLSNLTALTSLRLEDCYNLTKDGFNPLITSSLKELSIINSGSVAADLLAEMATMPEVAFQLEHLEVDSISAALVAPVCSFLAPTLRKLSICGDDRVKVFSDEQEGALQLLTSLERLSFYDSDVLQSLPEGLHQLPSLTELRICRCPGIKSLPKKGLPSSLEKLSVSDCSSELEEQSKIFQEEKNKRFEEERERQSESD
uniref:Uncharacterized protein n=1 Tax=Oryza brachyantha TaxID=4533 RepID=J3KVU1_ORYBR